MAGGRERTVLCAVQIVFCALAQILQVFDSKGRDFNLHDLQQFLLPYYVERIARDIRERLRVLEFLCTTGYVRRGCIACARCHCDVRRDWSGVDSVISRDVALQGNLDTVVRYSSRDAIEREVKRMTTSPIILFRSARSVVSLLDCNEKAGLLFDVITEK